MRLTEPMRINTLNSVYVFPHISHIEIAFWWMDFNSENSQLKHLYNLMFPNGLVLFCSICGLQ